MFLLKRGFFSPLRRQTVSAEYQPLNIQPAANLHSSDRPKREIWNWATSNNCVTGIKSILLMQKATLCHKAHLPFLLVNGFHNHWQQCQDSGHICLQLLPSGSPETTKLQEKWEKLVFWSWKCCGDVIVHKREGNNPTSMQKSKTRSLLHLNASYLFQSSHNIRSQK